MKIKTRHFNLRTLRQGVNDAVNPDPEPIGMGWK